jgi:hypothetical protein
MSYDSATGVGTSSSGVPPLPSDDANAVGSGGQSVAPVVTQASGKFTTPDGKVVEIREVWAYNLDEEMEKIREVLINYPYVAMVNSMANCFDTIINTFLHFCRPLIAFHRTQNFPE